MRLKNYLLISVLLFASCDETVRIEKCNFEKMNSIPYIDELTTCKCECLCIGENQKFCGTRNSKTVETQEAVNGDFELGNQDWTLTGDATITQPLGGDWYGGIPLIANSSYDGVLSQTFTTTETSRCRLSYNVFNAFDEPNIPEAQGRVTFTLKNSSGDIIFTKTTGEKISESVLEILSLPAGTYTIEVDINGATLQTVGRSGVDNVSLVCEVVSYLPCEVVLMPSNTVLTQSDISTSKYCVDVPDSTECAWLEVSCEDHTEIPLTEWQTGDGDPFTNPFDLDLIEFVQLSSHLVDLACDPDILIGVTLIDPHAGSEITFDGGTPIAIANIAGVQFFTHTPTTESVTVRIQNTDSSVHSYEISSTQVDKCTRKTISFKQCEDCEKKTLLSWKDKCTGIESAFYVNGPVGMLEPTLSGEEYLTKDGELLLLGQNKMQKQYELATDSVCDEVLSLISDASVEESFKINGVRVIPTASGSFEGIGLRSGLFTFKKAILGDTNCCC